MSIFKDFFGEGDEDTILEENKQLRKKRKHDKEDYKKLKGEYDDVVKKFLKKHTEFELVPFLENLGEPFGTGMVTLVPAFFGSDGFFIAKLRKNKGGKV